MFGNMLTLLCASALSTKTEKGKNNYLERLTA